MNNRANPSYNTNPNPNDTSPLLFPVSPAELISPITDAFNAATDSENEDYNPSFASLSPVAAYNHQTATGSTTSPFPSCSSPSLSAPPSASFSSPSPSPLPTSTSSLSLDDAGGPAFASITSHSSHSYLDSVSSFPFFQQFVRPRPNNNDSIAIQMRGLLGASGMGMGMGMGIGWDRERDRERGIVGRMKKMLTAAWLEWKSMIRRWQRGSISSSSVSSSSSKVQSFVYLLVGLIAIVGLVGGIISLVQEKELTEGSGSDQLAQILMPLPLTSAALNHTNENGNGNTIVNANT